MNINDFIPPITIKAWKRINRKIRNSPIHPFDCLPKNVSPTWFLDIGANIGDVTISALKSYRKCKAICFEPVKETYDVLSKRLIPYEDRYYLYNVALSDSNGEGEINITSFHGANSILPQSDLHRRETGVKELRKQKIKLIKLDDIASDLPARKIDIMKIDVEGFEQSVLDGGFKFISTSVDIIIIELAPYRNDLMQNNYVANIFAFMKSAGFTLINVFDVEHIKNHPNLLLGQMDCVFIHNSKL